MDILTKEYCEKIIKENKENIYVICCGNYALKDSIDKVSAFIAFSKDEAFKYFNSISNQLPENMKEFNAFHVTNIDEIYDLNILFDYSSLDKILIINYGFLLKSYLYKINENNVQYISKIIENMKDTDKIYAVFDQNNNPYKINNTQAIFFNREEAEKASRICNGKVLEKLIIEPIFQNLIWDLGEYCLNNYQISGKEFNEALEMKFKKDCLNKEELKEIIKKGVGFCLGKDNSGAALGYYNCSLLFTNFSDYNAFDKSAMTHPCGFYKINFEKMDLATFNGLLFPNSDIVFIDGKVHCLKIDLLDALSEILSII